jgi:hypothetical protein
MNRARQVLALLARVPARRRVVDAWPIRARAPLLLAAALLACCRERNDVAEGGAAPSQATASTPAPAAASAKPPTSAEVPPDAGAGPPKEIAVTRDGLLLMSDGHTLRAARCGEPERLVEQFTDPRDIVPAPDGDAVFWLMPYGTRQLDVKSWAIRQVSPRSPRYDAIAADRDAVYRTYPSSTSTTVLRVTREDMTPTELLVVPDSRIWKAHVSRRYLWLQINFTTLSRTDPVRDAKAPERVTTLPDGASWDVVADADAALVIEGGEVAVHRGSPPVRGTLSLPAAAREICVGAPRTLYWIDREGHVRRTALTPSLAPGATEIVATGEGLRRLACAGDHVAWLHGPEERPQVAHGRTGAQAATCR